MLREQLIQRNNNTYTFLDDVSGNIVVSKDFITFDGAGFTLNASGYSLQTGIDLTSRKNVTVKNLVIIDYDVGIFCGSGTTNITISGNYIHNCGNGIEFLGASNNTIKYNTFKDNSIDVSIEYVLGNNLITQNSVDSYIQVWMSDQQTIDMNYWTDYNGTDNDGDGIGDTPYYYHETLMDYHPLIDPIPVIPEFPSWTLLIAGFLAVTVFSIIFRRNFKQGRKI